MPFDEASLAAIGEELGVRFEAEPYRVRGAAVYAATVAAARQPLRLILWPSIGRVDARTAQATLVLKDVEQVDIYAGVEVTFRRRGGGSLFVTREGMVHMAV